MPQSASPQDGTFDRLAHLGAGPDAPTVRYRIDFVGDSERWMVERAMRQAGGRAKFRSIMITVHPADRAS